MTALSGSIQLRSKTAAQWLAYSTPPLINQPCVESDTGQLKIGDGVSLWSELSYVGNTSSGSRLISGGGITIVTDDITVAEANYSISGFGTFTSPETAFNNIALSSSGTQRFVAFYGKTDSTVVKVEGTEGAVASMPSGPANSVLINYSLVTSAAIGSGVDLSGYLLKSDKATSAEVLTGTDNAKYITPAAMAGAKGASGGYVGLTLFKINFKNALNTFTSFFTNSNTASRTYTFQDRNGTIADDTDLANKVTTIAFGGRLLNYADATTYYFQTLGTEVPITANSAVPGVAPLSGTIVKCTIATRHNGTPSLENSSFEFMLNNTGTWITITSTYQYSGNAPFSVACTYGLFTLNTAITAGDVITVRTNTPNWVTNPTQIYTTLIFFIK